MSLDTDAPPRARDDFHRLLIQNQRAIYGFILTLLPQAQDVEEVFQETCVVILSKAEQFRGPDGFLAWACQIARFEVFNFRRRQQAEKLRFSDELIDALSAKRLSDHQWEDRGKALALCMAKLSPQDRALIERRYREPITSKDLAHAVGRPANTVYKALNRIRQSLLACIERAVALEEHSP